jgi:hypothetical protein
VTAFQKYRLRSIFPSLQFFNSGQVAASSSLQSSNSEEARAFPSLMALPIATPLLRIFQKEKSFRKSRYDIRNQHLLIYKQN